MNNINICYTINNNKKYIDLTLESISSIKKFFRSKKYRLNFFIISEDKLNLPDYITNIISPYKDIPLMHQRIYISELLNVDRVIFLDSDTYITTCLSKLWEIDMQDKIIGMSPHYHINTINECIELFNIRNEVKEYSFLFKEQYFNAGVVLIDCKKWIKNDLTNICKDFLNIIKDTKHYKNEEFTYNIALRNHIYVLDEVWNYFPRSEFKRVKILHYYGIYNKDKPKHDEVYSG